MLSFPDHLSTQSSDYARYRPLYPAVLYDYLASLTPEHDRAWDVGTGNGQAALGLAQHFRSIIATDPGEQQIALAAPHDRVTYRVATAEDSGLEDQSIDLITMALAVHWFDLDRFYVETRRVLRSPDAVSGNRTLQFPFAEIAAPKFAVGAKRTIDDLFGYLSSWSAAQKFTEARGFDLLNEVRATWATAWGSLQARTVRWPLYLRVGR
jgi:SAM-dependent methyltransferase